MDDQELPHNACWTFVFKKIQDEWNVVEENGAPIHIDFISARIELLFRQY